MLKKINRLLKFIGLNLVHAKKAKSSVARRAKAYVAGSDCGKTHYVGDSCPGGHGHVDASPTQDNNITGPTS